MSERYVFTEQEEKIVVGILGHTVLRWHKHRTRLPDRTWAERPPEAALRHLMALNLIDVGTTVYHPWKGSKPEGVHRGEWVEARLRPGVMFSRDVDIDMTTGRFCVDVADVTP